MSPHYNVLPEAVCCCLYIARTPIKYIQANEESSEFQKGA